MAFNPNILRTSRPQRFGGASAGGFNSSRRFQKMFRTMIGKKALNKNPKGLDRARGLGQIKAAIAGKNNTKRTPLAPSIDPVAAALQHTVRNRAVEQASNAINLTASMNSGRNAPQTILKFLGGR